MASKGLQDLKQQVEGTAQEAGEDSARPKCQRPEQQLSKWWTRLQRRGRKPWTSWPRPPRKPSTRLPTRPLRPSLGSGKSLAS
ncbi:adipogenesis regulatory factor isoform X1 [Saimiri boliviensis]|uniref:adipogenesis regulatory factor isoform X1 n=1 Tax=Saimiri boliviensis TaxID=27679 RepID=UPI003D779155